MISVDEALQRIISSTRLLGVERIPLSSSLGRSAREDVTAKVFNPAFDVSAMDGYAVRAADVIPGEPLTLIGSSQAGAGFSGKVGPHQCVRIFTGAPVPNGADAVIMQEDASADGTSIRFNSRVDPGRSIRFRGEDFAVGQTLVKTGDRLTPQRLGLAAAGNAAELTVSLLPNIALLATGDELVPPGARVGPDQIISSNSIALSALLSRYSDAIEDHGIAPDNRERLQSALSQALDKEPDVLITTGGASVGDHDFVQDVLTSLGVEIDFWRIAMRPGKPLMFGRHGKTLIFGLPGNPVSAFVTARLFVVPALDALCGSTPRPPMHLPLAAPLPANGPRRHFLRGQFTSDQSHGTQIVPIAQIDSGHLSSLATADVLIEQAEHCPGREKGEIVAVHLLG